MHHLPALRAPVNDPPSDNELESQPLSPRRAAESLFECADDADHEGIMADVALAKRCVAGEVAAWEQLYGQCHDALLGTVQKMLGPQGADFSLVDEIAARVWYALVADDGELLQRYSPKYGARLITFMRALAKDEITRHLRSERRRHRRERRAAAKKSSREHSFAVEMNTSLSEFLVTLSPAERGFADNYLLAPANQPASIPEPKPPKTSFWRLTSRIRKKLIDFFRL
jgi:hypothetical protein